MASYTKPLNGWGASRWQLGRLHHFRKHTEGGQADLGTSRPFDIGHADVGFPANPEITPRATARISS
jgi:hypothetical protein